MSDHADLTEARIDRERGKLAGLLNARVAPSGVSDCEDCGEPIPSARLAAAPFATRCLRCQEIVEASQ